MKLRSTRRRPRRLWPVLGLVMALLIAVLGLLAMRHTFGHWIRIHGHSMAPGVPDGSLRYMNTQIEPQVGDVVLVAHDEHKAVRRMVAQAGDRVALKRGRISINDRHLVGRRVSAGNETGPGTIAWHLEQSLNGSSYPIIIYGPDTQESERMSHKPILVPKGSVYVLCDNRVECPNDTSFGLIPITRILGVVTESVWPSFGRSQTPSRLFENKQ